MLKEILQEANAIQLQVDTSDWKEALSIVAKPLIDRNFIEERYVEAIKKITEETGPYYVFEDEMFALPHARPEEGVNKLGFSLITLKTPISINSSPDVDLIIMLCAKDGNSHIEYGLKPIFELLSDPEIRQKVKSARSSEEILELL